MRRRKSEPLEISRNPITESRREKSVNTSVVFWGLCAILVFLPLPFGAVDERTIFLFEAATAILFGMYVWGRRPEKSSEGSGGDSVGAASVCDESRRPQQRR